MAEIFRSSAMIYRQFFGYPHSARVWASPSLHRRETPEWGATPVTRIAILFLSVLLAGTAHAQERFITLSSTTSTQDSGLFDYILPIFKTAAGLSVHVVAVGTGQALAIGERGDADALLVHDRPGEDKFVAGGSALIAVM